MKTVNYFIIIVSTLVFCGFASESEILKIRILYYKATTNEDDASAFFETMQQQINSKDALVSGYVGMSYMIEAGHVWNPYNKLSYFNIGKNYVDKAIVTEPKNPELRFLRFGVQTNAPAFLGYNTSILEDKMVIIKTYASISDADLKTRIKEFMQNSSDCSSEEKNIFK